MAERHKLYVKRFPAKRRLTNKLSWIKKKHGALAKQYFLDHPACETCGEERIACLHVHHKKGKSVEEFQVLCGNCHAVHHGGSYTVKDCL